MTTAPEFTWRTSSYSGDTGSCVEIAESAAEVRVRDTKDRPGGTLRVEREAWRAFLISATGSC